MRLFISYARRDREPLTGLLADLERSGHDPWIDRDISGGRQWWDELLGQIRVCDALLFALSPDSLASRACRAELAYGAALGRPVLPVMLRDTNVELAPDPIGMTQIVDYRQRNSESAIGLVTALARLPPARPLPDPLPEPPLPPITDLAPARDALAHDSLSFAEQRALLDELARRKDELDQTDTLRALLVQFRRRGDVAESIAQGIDSVLAALPADGEPEDRVRVRRPISERDPDSVDRLRALVTHVRSGRLTPILGHGLNDQVIGSPRALAREWSRTFEFPMARHQQDSAPSVTQFIAVMTDVDTLRSSLDDHLRRCLRARHPDVPVPAPGDLGTAIRTTWRAVRTPDDPYLVLAELPCPIYITADHWSLLGDALREAGREPVVEVCRWRTDVYDWPASVFEIEPAYVPSVDRPLVFHVFGALDTPDSLVLTEDDFDDFSIAVAENRSIVPNVVQRVLANSAIMLLGFDLEERDVRVLLRSLIGQEGARKLNKYSHVAAQLEFGGGVMSPARAQRYMERYFSKIHQPSIDLFWGTVEEFSADLAELWRSGR